MAFAASAAAQAEDAAQPVALRVTSVGHGVRVDVVGHAAQRYDARFTLRVEGGSGSNVNRTEQRGLAHLLPGTPVTLTSVVLADAPRGGWSAFLRVEPNVGDAYERTAP